MSGMQTIDDWIAQLRSLPGMLESQGPDVIEAAVRNEIDASLAAGRSLDGYQWAPRVKDGARAFADAAKYVSITRSANYVVVTITGPLVYAQFGTGKMKPRPLLPTAGLPARLGSAIAVGLVDMGADWMNRKGSHGKWGKGVRASMRGGG